jgi:hypothetical protein
MTSQIVSCCWPIHQRCPTTIAPISRACMTRTFDVSAPNVTRSLPLSPSDSCNHMHAVSGNYLYSPGFCSLVFALAATISVQLATPAARISSTHTGRNARRDRTPLHQLIALPVSFLICDGATKHTVTHTPLKLVLTFDF